MSTISRLWSALKLLLAFALPVVLAALILHFESVSLGPGGSLRDSHLVGLLSLVLAVIPLGLLLLGLVALIYVKRKSLGALLIASCLVYTVMAFASTELRWKVRISAFDTFAERSRPLIEALYSYAQARGASPPKLASLAPEYLSRIPDTGMGAFPHFDYVRDHESVSNLWSLQVTISESPPARLLYRSDRNYTDLTGAQIAVGEWTFEFHEYNRRP